MLSIRQETEKDFRAVHRLVKQAFATAEHSDGMEHKLVAALRNSDAFIPELSLVAQKDGRIVGYILFTKIKVGGHTELALAPLAVAPSCQRQGVGTALIQAGHRISKQLGFHCSVVLGSDKYYPRLGYLPAETWGILAPFPVSSEQYMAYPLQDIPIDVEGVVQYAKEFGIEGDI